MSFYLTDADAFVPAGETKSLSIAGSFLHCFESNLENFKIKSDTSDFSIFAQGLGFTAEFSDITIYNPYDTDLVATFQYGKGGFLHDTRNVPQGKLSIFNTQGLICQPLVEDGGIVVPQGLSNFNLFYSNVSGSNHWETVFTAAQNTNGVILNHAIIVHNIGVNTQGKWIGIYPDNGVPFVTSVEANSMPKELEKVRYIPAGVGLDVLWPDQFGGHVMIEYDFL